MCGNQAVPLVNARIISKRKGTWKCGKCNSSLTKVYRTQPNAVRFLTMPVEQRNELWKKVNSCCSAEEINNALQTFSAVKENKEERFFHNNGKFLPLEVWAHKGFDRVRIDTLTSDEDRRVDRVLGMTYRVEIMSTGNRGSEGTITSEALKVTHAPNAAKSSTDEVKRLAGELERVKKKQKLDANACKNFAGDIKKCGTQVAACKATLIESADVFGQAVHTQSNNLFGKFECLRGKLASDEAAKDIPPTWLASTSCFGHSCFGHSCCGHSCFGHSCFEHSCVWHSCCGHSCFGHSCFGHSRFGHSCFLAFMFRAFMFWAFVVWAFMFWAFMLLAFMFWTFMCWAFMFWAFAFWAFMFLGIHVLGICWEFPYIPAVEL